MSLRSVCVFCGASPGASPVYREAAEALGQYLAERGIRLIYGGGAVGLMGSAGAVAYSTAKAGLHGFTQSVAADYATQNIRANCIIVG